jgi:phosphate uptake regulator
MSGTQVPTSPPTQLYRGLSLGSKLLEVVADHTIPSSAEVKKSGAVSPHQMYVTIMSTGQL